MCMDSKTGEAVRCNIERWETWVKANALFTRRVWS
jgi:hypothetical protein